MPIVTRPSIFRIGFLPIAAAAAFFFVSPIHAQPNSLTVELDFASEPPCPDHAAFTRWVDARVARPIQWTGGSFAFQVRVSRQGEEFRGHLLARSGEDVTERDLTGQNCADVVSGLALVAALALDPNASTAPQPAEQIARAGEAPPAAREPAPQTPKPSPAATVRPAPEPFVRPFDSAPAGPPSYAIGVLGALSADAGPAPVVLFALGPKVVTELYSSSLWQPSFGLALQFARSGFLGAEEPAADFRWTVVRLSICPLGSEITRGGRLRACVLGDIGSMSAEGRAGAVPTTERTTQFWAATGPGATFSYHPISPLFIELGAGGLVAWTQPVYFFAEPRKDIHEVPPLAFTAHIGLGLSFSDQ